MKPEVIYGLFEPSGSECLYIGRTRHPETRAYSHKCNKSRKGYVFRKLRIVMNGEGDRIEGQVIRAFKRKGQASLNQITYIAPKSYESMSRNRLSTSEIGALIRAGKTFEVRTERERKAALQAAKYAGIEVASRALVADDGGGFRIYFLQGIVR